MTPPPRYRTRATYHLTTKAVNNHNHDQQHQWRAVFRARQRVFPTWTDRQGQSTLCDHGGIRERARTDQSAQRCICGIHVWVLGHGPRAREVLRAGLVELMVQQIRRATAFPSKRGDPQAVHHVRASVEYL